MKNLFKKFNSWFNSVIWYPLFSRLYWNFGIVDRFSTEAALMRFHKSFVITEVFSKGEPKLMRCRFPNGEFIEYLAKRYRIKTIVSLEDEYDKDIDSICVKYKINHFKDLNTASAKTIFQGEQGKKQLETYFKLLSEVSNFPMIIRCRGGADRTGAACAVYRIEKQGWKNWKAWLEMITYFHFFWKYVSTTKFVLSYKKRK